MLHPSKSSFALTSAVIPSPLINHHQKDRERGQSPRHDDQRQSFLPSVRLTTACSLAADLPSPPLLRSRFLCLARSLSFGLALSEEE